MCCWLTSVTMTALVVAEAPDPRGPSVGVSMLWVSASEAFPNGQTSPTWFVRHSGRTQRGDQPCIRPDAVSSQAA